MMDYFSYLLQIELSSRTGTTFCFRMLMSVKSMPALLRRSLSVAFPLEATHLARDVMEGIKIRYSNHAGHSCSPDCRASHFASSLHVALDQVDN